VLGLRKEVAAHVRGSADAIGTTRISLGPAIESIATAP